MVDWLGSCLLVRAGPHVAENTEKILTPGDDENDPSDHSVMFRLKKAVTWISLDIANIYQLLALCLALYVPPAQHERVAGL
jgi:hypothetical protein